MAESDIKLVAELQPKDVVQSAKELGKGIDKAIDSQVGRTTDAKIKSNLTQLAKLRNESDKLTKSIESNLGKSVVTKEFEDATKQVESLGSQLDKANDKLNLMRERVQNGKAWKSAQMDIMNTKGQITELNTKIDDEFKVQQKIAAERTKLTQEYERQKELLEDQRDTLRVQGRSWNSKPMQENRRAMEELEKQTEALRQEQRNAFSESIDKVENYKNQIEECTKVLHDFEEQQGKVERLAGLVRAQEDAEELATKLSEAESEVEALKATGKDSVLWENTDEGIKQLDDLANKNNQVRVKALQTADAIEKQNQIDLSKIQNNEAKLQQILDDLTTKLHAAQEEFNRMSMQGYGITPEGLSELQTELDTAKQHLEAMQVLLENVNNTDLSNLKEQLAQAEAEYQKAIENTATLHEQLMSLYAAEQETGTNNALIEDLEIESEKAREKVTELTDTISILEKEIQIKQSPELISGMQVDIDDTKVKVEELETAVQNAKIAMEDDSGQKAFANKGEEIQALQDNVSKVEEALTNLKGKEQEVEESSRNLKATFTNIGNTGFKAFMRIGQAIEGFLVKLKAGIKNLKLFSRHTKDADRSSNDLSRTLKRGVRLLLRYGLGLRSFFFLFRRIRAAIIEGVTNVAKLNQGNNDTNRSISMLMGTLAQLKNQWGAAFAPIIQMVIPALNRLAQAVTYIGEAVANMLAKLTGKSTFLRATKQVKDFAGELENAGDKAKETEEKLGSYDKLEVIRQDKDTGAASGLDDVANMFEEVPVDLAETWLDKFLKPIKEAWARMGDYVVESWKKAFNSIKELLNDIGSDFLEVWNEEATIKMFENILGIIGDIGLIVSALADNLRKAWNENQTGKKILQNIRDIFATIVQHIRNASQYTIGWARNLDFSPFLQAAERLLRSIKGMADGVWGILEDIYKYALLPIAKFTIEDGLPRLLDIFTEFNNSINWTKIRTSLRDLWTVLTDIAKIVWNNLLIFVEKFLVPIGKWVMNTAIPALADAFKRLYESVDWNALTQSLTNVWNNLKNFVIGIGQGLINFIDFMVDSGIAAVIIESIAGALELISRHLGVVIGLFVSYKVMTILASLITSLTGVGTGLTGISSILATMGGPVALAIAGIGLLVGVLLDVSFSASESEQALQDLRDQAEIAYRTEEIDIFGDSVDNLSTKIQNTASNLDSLSKSSIDYVQNAGAKEAAHAQILAERYQTLRTKTGELTEGELAEFKRITGELVAIYPSLNDYVNTENGLLDIQPEKLQEIIDKQRELAKVKALEERMAQLYVDQELAQQELKKATEDVKKATEEAQKEKERFAKLDELVELKKEYERLTDNIAYMEETTGHASQASIDYANSVGDKVSQLCKELGINYADVANEYVIQQERMETAEENKQKLMKDKKYLEEVLNNTKWTTAELDKLYKDMYQKIYDGQNKVADDQERVAKKGAKKFKDGYSEYLEIASPSKVAKRMGEDWNEGMAQGISRTSSLDNSIRTVTSGITSKFSTMLDNIRTQVSNLPNTMSSMSYSFESIGSNMAYGMQNGFNRAISSVYNSVSYACNNLARTARYTLGVYSPSRVFAEIGEFTMLGFEEGWKDEEDNMLKILSKTSNLIVDSFGTDLKVNIPDIAKGKVVPNTVAQNVVRAQSIPSTHDTASNTNDNRSQQPIVLQLAGREVARVVWDEEEKRYKQTGRYTPYG